MINSNPSYNQLSAFTIVQPNTTPSKESSRVYSENSTASLDIEADPIPGLVEKSIGIIKSEKPIQGFDSQDFDPLEDFLDSGEELVELSDKTISNLSKTYESSQADDLDILEANYENETSLLQDIPEKKVENKQTILEPSVNKNLKNTDSLDHITIITKSTVEQMQRAVADESKISLNIHFKKINLLENHSEETLNEISWAVENQAIVHIIQKKDGTADIQVAERYADFFKNRKINQIHVSDFKEQPIQTIDASEVTFTTLDPSELDRISRSILIYVEISYKRLQEEQKKIDKKDESKNHIKVQNERHRNRIENGDELQRVDKTENGNLNVKSFRKTDIPLSSLINTLTLREFQKSAIKEKETREIDQRLHTIKKIIIEKSIEKWEILNSIIKNDSLSRSESLSKISQSINDHSVHRIISAH